MNLPFMYGELSDKLFGMLQRCQLLCKIEMAIEQNGLVFIDSPVSCPMWCGEGQALVCAGLPCPCRREVRPWSVFQPLMSKV